MRSVKIKEVIDALERFAPLPLQESYDNAGLQVGLTEAEVSGALLCLDVTEKVVDEAIRRGCNLIVAHHPLIFCKLAQVTDANYVQRTVIKAIKNDIVIAAMHTNLDSAVGGVNYKIAEQEIQICVIGHYQSEQFTTEVLRDIIEQECPGLKCYLSEINTNPIGYF